MIHSLRLVRFKNFRDAELSLGPLTTLIGANGAGKSNLRDAFRFLHGVARGYHLADIFGEKYGEGGELQWRGIRGGARETAFDRGKEFSLSINLDVVVPYDGHRVRADYAISVGIGPKGGAPLLSAKPWISMGLEFWKPKVMMNSGASG